MRFFILVACLVATVFSRRFAHSDFQKNDLGDYVHRFTCDRHVVMRCFNILGKEVDDNGYLLKKQFGGRLRRSIGNYNDNTDYPWLKK